MSLKQQQCMTDWFIRSEERGSGLTAGRLLDGSEQRDSDGSAKGAASLMSVGQTNVSI